MKTEGPPSRGAARRKPMGGPSFRKTELARFLVRARQAAGLRGRVDLLLADDATLSRLNGDYRRKPTPTDVLSFPGMAMPGKRRAVAGDLAISVETAARQAAEQGHSLEDELKILLLHGVLHLAGYDHETDDGAMRRVEQRLRKELSLPVGLIERNGPQGLKPRLQSRANVEAKASTYPGAKAKSSPLARRRTA